MEEEILKRLEQQQQKIDAMYQSVEKLRKYFLWTLVVTVVTVVGPLIAALFILPYALRTFSSLYGGLL